MAEMTDNEKFMRHWTRAQPVVAGYVGSLVPDFHEAEDLLQEVSVVLLRKFSEYDETRPFVAWALGVAKYEVLASRRSHARSFISYHEKITQAVAEVYEEMTPELEARAAALKDCLGRLQGRSRELLSLRYEKALKPRQIASRLSMASGAVRTALSRTRQALGECVERTLAAGGRRI
jgi:RNA polymerase sigma-70 factor (ECF subfamily)